jgi:hypothetical protein
MSPSADPLTQLVDALLAGSDAGTVAWEQADSRGRTFIARGSGGTVRLTGVSSPTLFGQGLTVKLAIQDGAGKTIEEYEAPSSPLGEAGGIGLNIGIDRGLQTLYRQVREQITRANETMASLAGEFAPK